MPFQTSVKEYPLCGPRPVTKFSSPTAFPGNFVRRRHYCIVKLFSKWSIFFLLSFCWHVHSETTLGGEVTQSYFDSTGNPYIIEGDISVPPGEECTIDQGCVFLFKPFTGLTVDGRLFIKGTLEHPVIFSSINNPVYNPNSVEPAQPFDWNGIVITVESSGSIISNLHLCHSVYGIQSETPSITIDQCLFYQNGQYHFTINRKIQSVLDNIPFSYGTTLDDKRGTAPGSLSASGIPDNPQEFGVPATEQSRKSASSKQLLRYSALTIGVLGAVGGAVLFSKVQEADREIPQMLPSNINPDTDNYYTRKEVNDVLEKRKLYSGGSLSGFILGGLGLLGFSLTFLF